MLNRQYLKACLTLMNSGCLGLRAEV
jgi:hypothetical protein